MDLQSQPGMTVNLYSYREPKAEDVLGMDMHVQYGFESPEQVMEFVNSLPERCRIIFRNRLAGQCMVHQVLVNGLRMGIVYHK